MKRVAIGIELDWPYEHHYDVVQGVLEYGRSKNWECRLEPGLETTFDIKELPDKYDGIIARVNQSLVDCCERQGVPLINTWTNTDAEGVSTVSSDRAKVGTIAAKYFLSRGFQHMAFIGRTEERETRNEFDAFKQQLEKKDLECVDLFLSLPVKLDEWAQFYQKISDWMKNNTLPLAIYVSDQLLGRYLCEWCLKNELMVPDDIAILSGRYNKLVCESFEPSITAVESRYDIMGYEAAKALDKLMNGEAVDFPILIAPGELHERRSTDVEPVEDRLIARAMRYIWDHSHEPLQVDDVVRPLNITRRSLERRFRQVLDRTINEEILRSRIERAKRILEESDDTVKSVAHSAGFSSGQRMAQVFKQQMGIVPTEYREQHRKQMDF